MKDLDSRVKGWEAVDAREVWLTLRLCIIKLLLFLFLSPPLFLFLLLL